MARSKKEDKKTPCITETWELIHTCRSFGAEMTSLPLSQTLNVETKIRLFIKTQAKSAEQKRNSSKRKADPRIKNIAYKFLGHPDEVQEDELQANIDGCRFLWNRMKEDRDYLYKALGITVKNTPADYKTIEGLEWLGDLDSYGLCNVQLRLEGAYSDWLSGKSGRPRFKNRRMAKSSYTTNKDQRSDNIRFEDGKLTLPKITGAITLECHRTVRNGATLKSCTVTHEPDGRWMFSLLYEYEEEERPFSDNLTRFFETGDLSCLKHIGLDMSLPHMYVDVNGQYPSYNNQDNVISFEKHYRKLETRIAREQRRLSRMVKDSANYCKQCEKIAGLHARAKQQRHDFLEQLSHRLAKEYDVISIEDLDLAAMKKSLKFGKSVSDNGWGEFITMLERKCEAYGHLLIRVDKWFPSSKKCIHCGHIHKELTLNDRTYVCPVCGHVMDRDKQAANNIDQEGLNIVFQYYTAQKAAEKAA